MQATWRLYAKLLTLFLLLLLIVSGHWAVRGFQREYEDKNWFVPAANAARAPALIASYGCGACHRVPGVRSATGTVGPRLDRMTEQGYIAGVLPNSPQNLVVWIQKPRDIDPFTAMPNLGVGERDARDIAAYLYRQR
jgi:cytochrome c1